MAVSPLPQNETVLIPSGEFPHSSSVNVNTLF